ncbi:hypothetical protein AAF712_016607 [Marasmius tenuissimus]|uniref:Uncharacterized protein n=1 Tax=Marasmius tenuissimus TaxID=585030 RepID=A0ABR2Z5D4_9AGAR
MDIFPASTAAAETTTRSSSTSSLGFETHNFDTVTNNGNITNNGSGSVFNGNFNTSGSQNSHNNSDSGGLSTQSSILPSSVLSSTSPGPSKAVIAGSVVGALALTLCLLSALVLFQKRKNKQKKQETMITPLPYGANFTSISSFPRKIRAAALRDQRAQPLESASAGMTEQPTADIQAQLTRILRRLETLEGNGLERPTPPDYVSIH